jgi:hypothetical protein
MPQRSRATGERFYTEAELAASVEAEREACAKMADEIAWAEPTLGKEIAKAIRSRNQQKEGPESCGRIR